MMSYRSKMTILNDIKYPAVECINQYTRWIWGESGGEVDGAQEGGRHCLE